MGKLEDMMRELALSEEDLDDVMYEEQEASAKEDLRWMIIVCVHMDKDFSSYWFFKNTRMSWDLACGVKIRTLEENLLGMQFNCSGD